MAKAIHVAEYMISLSEINSMRAITPLKLQKLLYLAQKTHIDMNKEMLFLEKTDMWAHGPVVLDVYHKYKSYGYFSIPSKPFDHKTHLTDKELQSIRYVWEEYGALDGKFLEEYVFMDITKRKIEGSAQHA